MTPADGCRVKLSDEAKQDVRDLNPLDGSDEAERRRKEFAMEVVKVTRRIEAHPWEGMPLREDGPIPGLGDLRKIPFDPWKASQPDYRLVYLLDPDGPEPKVAKVVAIGLRRNQVVYTVAASRRHS